MIDWAQDAIFYHLFPLGCLGAPERDSFDGSPANRLSALMRWIDYLDDLGANAIRRGGRPVYSMPPGRADIYVRPNIALDLSTASLKDGRASTRSK